MGDNFDVFMDRAQSLLLRWKKFHEEHRDMDNISSRCITGFLGEISDDYTKALIGEVNLDENRKTDN